MRNVGIANPQYSKKILWKILGRCFKCGEEGHKKDDCPTQDEAADERKTDNKQSGKYGK